MKTALMITLTIVILYQIFLNENNREWIYKYTKGENLYIILLICILFLPALFDFRLNEKIQELKRKLNNQTK